jgi:hypothetical protein
MINLSSGSAESVETCTRPSALGLRPRASGLVQVSTDSASLRGQVYPSHPQTVWGLNRAEEVFVRIGITIAEPRGKDWTKVDGSMKNIR